jgi:hypothetical protein
MDNKLKLATWIKSNVNFLFETIEVIYLKNVNMFKLRLDNHQSSNSNLNYLNELGTQTSSNTMSNFPSKYSKNFDI